MESPWYQDFPALSNNPSVSYFDSASSSQVPYSVINAIQNYLSNGHANVHRGMYPFSERANTLYEQTREKVAQWIGAKKSEQIIFTKSATEAIQLVAHQFTQQLSSEDCIITTTVEHHANLLPWLRLTKEHQAQCHVLPLQSDGCIDFSQLEQQLQQNCRLLALSHHSNVLASAQDIQAITALAHRYQVPVLVDGAQAVAHHPLDVSTMDCDYYVFSAHKMYAPTGCGVLYAKDSTCLAPLLVGGGIVQEVTTTDYKLLDSIQRLEAGSPNIVAIVGLQAAIDYIEQQDRQAIIDYEQALTTECLAQLNELTELTLLPRPSPELPIFSFVSAAYHSHDISSILAMDNVCVRAGHHCAQPLLTALGHKHCVRLSLGLYNQSQDIQRLATAWQHVQSILN